MPAALPQLPAVLLHQVMARAPGVALLGRDEIRIQVEPAHLGRVQVILEMHQGQVAAHIRVESEEVRRLLEDQTPSLRQSLEQQGVRLQSLEVSVQDRNAALLNPDGQNAESFFHRRRHAGPESREAAPLDDENPVPAADTGRRWGFNTVEYIA